MERMVAHPPAGAPLTRQRGGCAAERGCGPGRVRAGRRGARSPRRAADGFRARARGGARARGRQHRAAAYEGAPARCLCGSGSCVRWPRRGCGACACRLACMRPQPLCCMSKSSLVFIRACPSTSRAFVCTRVCHCSARSAGMASQRPLRCFVTLCHCWYPLAWSGRALRRACAA